MNEELQKALAEILNGVLTAKDFIMAELPEVLQQLLLWKFCYYAIQGVVGFTLIVATPILIIKSWKWLQAIYEDRKEKEGGYVEWMNPISLIWLVLLLPGFICLNIKWLQIWVAPKVYLIEYAASLTK